MPLISVNVRLARFLFAPTILLHTGMFEKSFKFAYTFNTLLGVVMLCTGVTGIIENTVCNASSLFLILGSVPYISFQIPICCNFLNTSCFDNFVAATTTNMWNLIRSVIFLTISIVNIIMVDLYPACKASVLLGSLGIIGSLMYFLKFISTRKQKKLDLLPEPHYVSSTNAIS